MFLRRILPPAASPIYPRDILSGLRGLCRGSGELKRFESELQDYFNVKHCFLFSSGKASLTVILKALKDLYPNRDEVLIPAYTCYSVPSAIVRAGLKIKLCDIDPQTLDFDFNQLSKIFTPPNSTNPLNPMNPLNPTNPTNPLNPKNLLAVIPVHLYGIPCDIERLRNLINDPEITIIEDAAQAMGGERAGQKLGTTGDVGFFSLGRGKALSTVEGGIILTNREDIAEKINALLDSASGYHFIDLLGLLLKAIMLYIFLHPVLFWFPKSLSFLKLGQTIYDPNFKIKKMSSFQAGMARSWRKKLARFQDIRSKNTKHWISILKNLKGTQSNPTHPYQLSAISYPITLSLNYQLSDSSFPITLSPNYQLSANSFSVNSLLPLIRFPLLVPDPGLRDQIIALSDRFGFGIMPGYPDTINNIPEIKNLFTGQEFLGAKILAERVITFPIHPFVSKNDCTKIEIDVFSNRQI